MIFLLLFTATAIGLILINFKLPNIKPFNCAPCLSSWVALGLLLWVMPEYWWVFPSAYLLTSIVFIYESK